MKPKLILIDGNNNSHRAFHTHGRLSFRGQSTSLTFGLLGILGNLVSIHKPDKLIVVWDGKKSAVRLKLYPEYKGKRKAKLSFDVDDFYRQRSDMMEGLTHLGVTQVYSNTMEADDYIYQLFRKYRKTHQVYVVSSDKDFLQIIPEGGMVIRPSDSKTIGKKNLEKHIGVEPSQVLDYHILVGDSSDNIKGIPGIGEVRAKQFLSEYGSISSYLSEAKLSGWTKKHEAFNKHYRLTLKLVGLRHYYNQHIKGKVKLAYVKGKKPKQKLKAFRKFCTNRGFQRYKNPDFTKKFKQLW